MCIRDSYYRKSFQLDKTIEQALLTIASAGLHELSINGQRAGNHFLDPMYTHFDKRILSVTHDVTSLLSLGENVIGVQLGNGWYTFVEMCIHRVQEMISCPLPVDRELM